MNVRASTIAIAVMLFGGFWVAVGGSAESSALMQRTLTVRTYSGADFGHTRLADSSFPAQLALGDFDNDERLDLAIGAPTDSTDAVGGGWVGVSMGGPRFPGPLHAEIGSERNGSWGAALAVGDFNADGYDDLVIGAPGRDFSGPDSGVLYLWSGSANGVGQQSRPFGPSLGAGARVGTALAVGDFNGDGVDDLAVGAPGAESRGQAGAGKVVLLPGRAGAGPIATGGLTLERGEHGIPGDPIARERLGAALVSGDLDGDGRSELVVGVPYGSVGVTSEAGLVLVAAMATYPVTGGLRVDQLSELSRDSADVPGDAGRNALFGAVLVSSDFDGDGRDDIAVASPGAFVGGQVAAGDVVVLHGSAGFPAQSRGTVLSEDTPGMPGQAASRTGFGTSLAAEDMDGDARADLAVGAPQSRVGSRIGVGTVTVVRSGAQGLDPTTGVRIEPGLVSTGFRPENRQAFGSSLLIGDLNGDEVADLAVGATGMTVDGAERAGALVVLWGENDSLPGVATATPKPVTPTATQVVSPTPGATATAHVWHAIALPYVTRLRSLDIWSTPVP